MSSDIKPSGKVKRLVGKITRQKLKEELKREMKDVEQESDN
jgi:hypothetical protein